MDIQNITLAVPKHILRKFKEIAFHRQKSVSKLMVEMMEELVANEEGYRLARKSHLRQMDSARSLGTEGKITWNRDDLHER